MNKSLIVAAKAAVIFAAMTSTLSAIASPQVAITTEEEFLQTAGAEWTSLSPGVWRRNGDNGYSEIGFGRAGAARYLDYLKSLRDTQESTRAASKASPTIASNRDLDEMISELDAALKSEGTLGVKGGTKAKAAAYTSYPGASVCGQPWYLNVNTSQGIATFSLTSTTDFTPFGPFAEATVRLYSTTKVTAYGDPTISDSRSKTLHYEQWASLSSSVMVYAFSGTWESSGSIRNYACSLSNYAYLIKTGSFN